jgi:hypothetical protein
MLVVANEPPVIDDPADEGDDDERWVTVGTYWSSPEAHVARLKLEAEDLECFLFDENFVATDWSIANAVHGIKLKVRASDARTATGLLDHLPAPSEFVEAIDSQPSDFSSNIPCPRCGSADIYRESAWRRPALTILFAAAFSVGFVLIFALPWILRHKRPWRCYDCGNEWAARGGTGARGFPMNPAS